MKERKVTIQNLTTKHPIQVMGYEAGICWEADTSTEEANYKRGLGCIENDHGRVMEFPQIYLTIEGYSARVIREFYTHIAGGPTRLQSSTRRVDCRDFNYITPPSIENNEDARVMYDGLMQNICRVLTNLEALGIPREDAALVLPLGMESSIVCRTNLRHLIDMSRQRMCTKAYHEYRLLFNDILNALGEYDEEYKTLIKKGVFGPKCDLLGRCPEKNGCGRKK